MKTILLLITVVALAGCGTLCTSAAQKGCDYPSLKVDQSFQGTGADSN